MSKLEPCVQLAEFADSGASDRVMLRHMAEVIAHRRAERGPPARPGATLKLLMAGYSGGGNIGSDLRVLETMRHLRAILRDRPLEFGLVAVGATLSPELARAARIERVDRYPPHYLADLMRNYDGVVVCEGSTFKSTFSDALSAVLVGALGLAAAEGKLAVAFGVEAGRMSEPLRKLVETSCADALVLARGVPSMDILKPLLPRVHLGTDVAWLADASDEAGRELLYASGWDGARRVLGVCPVDPFRWPEHRAFGDPRRRLDQFLQGLAIAVQAFCEREDLFPLIVGMEPVDAEACTRLASLLPMGAPVVLSGQHDARTIVGALRQSHVLVSARYHALVLTMPWGVPSLGIAMDERVRTLFGQREQPSLCVDAVDAQLAENVLAGLQHIVNESEQVRREIGRTVAQQVRLQAEMGRRFAHELRRLDPGWDPPEGEWRSFLPTLPARVDALLRDAPLVGGR